MRLPGTRYQEHGWEQVRKLLGRCSLQAFARSDVAQLLDPGAQKGQLALYVAQVAAALPDGARAEGPGNSYGESVAELALGLLYELQARPADWAAFCAAVAAESARSGRFWELPGGEASLRKKVNDMFAVLRDKVDSDNYQVACGRECSANRMYTYRMLDTAYGDIAAIFADWHGKRAQVATILGREVDAVPIEVRQMKSIAGCKAEWVIRWSASREQFGAGPGPLHTHSKRFASLKNNPDRIAEMMAEIGDYEELSSNRDQDWLHDADEATQWLDDLWRVLDEAAPGDEETLSVSLSPRSRQVADVSSVLAEVALPVRLAVFLKMLGGADESYPDAWRDSATGELPTMAQLALQAGISLPTLRKRRDAAIATLKGWNDEC